MIETEKQASICEKQPYPRTQKTQTRSRRKKLPRVTDWCDGVGRILDQRQHHPIAAHAMFLPIQHVGMDILTHETRKNKSGKPGFITVHDLNAFRPSKLTRSDIIYVLGQEDDVQIQTTDDTDKNGILDREKKTIYAHDFPPITFIEQHIGTGGLTYETLINSRGNVLTRPNNWHDVLNALTWYCFPRGKRMLNCCQVAASELHAMSVVDGENNSMRKRNERSMLQSKLAHFDECGGVLLLPNTKMLETLESRNWVEFFFENRHCWLQNCNADGGVAKMLIFGHGLLEQGLVRVPSMVANCLVFVMENQSDDLVHRFNRSCSAENEKEALILADEILADHLKKLLKSITRSKRKKCVSDTSSLNTDEPGCNFILQFSTIPVPLFGIPGWSVDEENDSEEFYLNRIHSLFR